MRMVHYFTALALISVPALLATAAVGIAQGGGEAHVMAGLTTGVLVIGTHTLLILFMIVTGRILREAMRARPLGPEFLAELNEFFAQKSAYPAAILAAFTTVATGVLGYATQGFGISPAFHMTAGILALVVNLWAFSVEYRAMRANQDLVDRAAAELDRLDRESPPPPAEPAEPDARAIGRFGLLLFVSAWMPYAYWGVVEHRGDFARTSLHPWLEASLLGLLVWLLARRERTA